MSMPPRDPDKMSGTAQLSAVPLQCPVTGSALAPCPPGVLAPLQQAAAIKALRDERAALVQAGFESGLLSADGLRCYLVYAGVADLRPGAAIVLVR